MIVSLGNDLSTACKPTKITMPSTCSDISTESAKPKIGGESIKIKSNWPDSFISSNINLKRSDPINLAGSGGSVPPVITFQFS